MNPEHEMLMDTLKGHTYKMSPWQYYEVRQHMDAEMMYIVTGYVAQFIDEIRLRGESMYMPDELMRLIANRVAPIMCERENFKGHIDCRRITNKMMAAWRSVENKGSGAMAVTMNFLIYAVHDSLIQIRYQQC